MRTWMNLLRAQAALVVVALVVVGLVGCAETTDKTAQKPDETAAPAKAAPAPAAKPAPAQPAQPAPKPSAAAQPTQPPPGHPPVPAVQKTSEPPKPPPADKPEAGAQATEKARAQAEDMIYANIRVKMEEMIAQRAQMLKSGKSPSDVEIRKLESSILKARDLLTQAGEVVGDIQPPITNPPQPPPTEKK